MVLPANGILIVALTMVLGLQWSDKPLIAAAFGLAGLSYLVNLLDALDMEWYGVRGVLYSGTVLLGLATYVYVALRLI